MTDDEFREAKNAVERLRLNGDLGPSVYWTLTCAIDALRPQETQARALLEPAAADSANHPQTRP